MAKELNKVKLQNPLYFNNVLIATATSTVVNYINIISQGMEEPKDLSQVNMLKVAFNMLFVMICNILILFPFSFISIPSLQYSANAKTLRTLIATIITDTETKK